MTAPDELTAREASVWSEEEDMGGKMAPAQLVINELLKTIAQERKLSQQWSHYFDQLMYALVCVPSEGVEAGVEKAHAIQRQGDALKSALGHDQPWPVADVLEKLAEASDILLRKHDYDGHGHELVVSARIAAKNYAVLIRRALAP